jgi:hypothetical protein
VRVTPGFFETMGIKVAGTSPTWSSVESETGPTVVSRAFAKRFWGETSPIGHGVKPYNDSMPSFPVVAVADDIRGTGLQEPTVEAIYFPIMAPRGGQWGAMRGMSFVVRAPGVNVDALTDAIRRVVSAMDAQIPIANVQSMVLLAVSVVATVGPTRRAARIDPVETMRG